jgi:hypothetical protein
VLFSYAWGSFFQRFNYLVRGCKLAFTHALC